MPLFGDSCNRGEKNPILCGGVMFSFIFLNKNNLAVKFNLSKGFCPLTYDFK